MDPSIDFASLADLVGGDEDDDNNGGNKLEELIKSVAKTSVSSPAPFASPPQLKQRLPPTRRSSKSSTKRPLKMSATMDESDYDHIVYIDSAEVTRNYILPGLQIFRLHNEKDDKEQLHHGYQILYVGDLEMGVIAGNLKCEVMSPTEIAVTIPAVPGVMVNAFSYFNRILHSKGKTSKPAKQAQATAVMAYKKDKTLALVKVLLRFERTGETITNRTWSNTKDHTGVVKPKVCKMPHQTSYKGKAIDVTYLVVGWNIARVEIEERYDDVNSDDDDGNLIGKELSSDEEEVDQNGTNGGAGQFDFGL